MLTVLFCFVVLGTIVFVASSRRTDPLDGRTPEAAIAEIASYTGISIPPILNVYGYRAGWGERFAKFTIAKPDFPSLLGNIGCETSMSFSQFIDGMDTERIKSWWTPRSVPRRSLVCCEQDIRTGPGRLAIVADTSDDEEVIVYLYSFKP